MANLEAMIPQRQTVMASPAPVAPPMPDALPETPRLEDGRADLTGQYNTELPAEQERKFQDWVRKNDRQGDLADYDLRGWFAKSGKVAANGHLTDEFKKPNHPTFSEGSIYHGRDGNTGGKWEKDGNKWLFRASKTNLDNLGADGLRRYFGKVEPGNDVVLPED